MEKTGKKRFRESSDSDDDEFKKVRLATGSGPVIEHGAQLDPDHLALLTGNSHPELAQGISDYLHIPVTSMVVDKFANTEVHVQIHENIRRKNVIIFQTGSASSNNSINDNIMEALIIANACKLSSAESVTLVIPNFPYARQDKKDVSRAPISGRLMADLFKTAGVTRVVALDLHAAQIAGFFDIPVDNLYAVNISASYIRTHYLQNNSDDYVLVSPDAGGVKRMNTLASKVGLDTVMMHKQRDHEKKSEVLGTILVGRKNCVRDKICIIVDDICDTAGTVMKACDTLMENGARGIILLMVHGLLSGPAIDRINGKNCIWEVIVTNSVPQDENLMRCPKLRVIDISSLLGETIRRLYTGESISALFD